MTRTSPIKRIVVVLFSTVLMSCVALMAWSIVGFGIASSLTGVASETMGYIQIILIPVAAVIGGVSGIVCGIARQPAALVVRWLLATVAISVLGLAVNGLIYVTR